MRARGGLDWAHKGAGWAGAWRACSQGSSFLGQGPQLPEPSSCTNCRAQCWLGGWSALAPGGGPHAALMGSAAGGATG